MAISLIESSDWLIGLLVDVSLKSILLAVVAGAAMAVLRVRNSSIRHRVWTAVLAGMLVMPLLAAWGPGVRLPTWAYPALHAVIVQERTVTPPIDSNMSASAPQIIDRASEAGSPGASSKVAASSNAVVASPPRETAADERPATNWMMIFKEMLAACYAVGVAVFGGRMLVGLAAAGRLVRSARAVELAPQQLSAIGATQVVQSSGVRVPLSVCWVRPTIVLPNDWEDWDESLLAAVFAHEQAHVERRDPWVTLVAQANRVVYWFHPLAWFLARRLTVLAEAVCDDAMIESLGDRTGYARHLLTIAGRLAGQSRRVQPVGVSMAARPAVENRIEAILDERRPLARRVGWVGSLVLLAVIAPMALLAGGIRADDAKPASDPAAEAASPVVGASDTAKLLLKVVDENDAPVSDAKVHVWYRSAFVGDGADTHEQVDRFGQLGIRIPKPTPYYVYVDVSKPGFVPFLAHWANYDSSDPIPDEYTVHLDAGRAIGGIVRDEQGAPIEGVKVKPWFNLKMREERTRQMPADAEAKTNAAGEWTYASLPADLQQVEVSFTHPKFKSQDYKVPISRLATSSDGHPVEVTVMTQGVRIGGRVTGPTGAPVANAKVKYYTSGDMGEHLESTVTDRAGKYEFGCGEVGGAMLAVVATEFAPAMRAIELTEGAGAIDFQLEEGQLLKTQVVGPNREPLKGVYLRLQEWNDHYTFVDFPGDSGKTDASGDWQWPHAPSGGLKFVISLPGHAYQGETLLTPGEANEVVLKPETAAKVVQKELVKLSGRVVDAKSGTPIGRFRTTAGWTRNAEGPVGWLHSTAAKGRDGLYRREFAQNELLEGMYCIALRVEADGYKPGVVLHVLKGEHDFKADVALEKADAADEYVVLSPSGAAVADAAVAVCTPRVGPLVQDGALLWNSGCELTSTNRGGQFTIGPQVGFFDLVVVHDSGASYVTNAQLEKSRTIRLEPWSRAEGMLKMHGEPAANEMITLGRDEEYDAMSPKIHYQYTTKTDQDGKFKFERVIPGGGRIARVAVTELGDGASRWTPTIASDVKFVAGETTHVQLERSGRQIVGKLALPADMEAGNDWRRAMISLQSRPRDFKSVSYSSRVNPDGTFAFDDIPAGDYHLQVSATAGTQEQVGRPKVIARLNYDFSVPVGAENSKKPFEVGTQMLEAVRGKPN